MCAFRSIQRDFITVSICLLSVLLPYLLDSICFLAFLHDLSHRPLRQSSKTKGIAHLRSAQMRTRQKRKTVISASVLVEFVAVNNNSWSNGHSHL
ncbi:hypothetical protein P8452_21249 [Trifolium repens]|nr:hypothetical protein P8452_21249 [Trifolium repens]